MLTFDEQKLLDRLNELSPPLRVAFATACAQRLLPAYLSYASRMGKGGAAAILSSVLSHLWKDVLGEKMSEQELEASIEACMELIPEEGDEPWVVEQASAEDAAAATAYALRCRENGHSQEAVWSARRAYEAIDRFVIDKEKIDTNVLKSEDAVLSHPLVAAELLRQERDVADLLDASDRAQETVSLVRNRAKIEAGIFFG